MFEYTMQNFMSGLLICLSSAAIIRRYEPVSALGR